jgi:glyoxylase-like metal-dependent hydrolase (beta-lactamase superfamily II)
MAFGDVREHQHETAIRIVGETLIARGFGQGKDGVIIQAEVQDGVHHARHRLTSAGTNGDQKRHAIFGAEGLAIDFFDFVKMFNDVFPDKIRNLLAGIVVESASFGRDGETIVDTGLGIGDIHSVVKAITDQPITVVVTHRHCDHDGGADWYPSYFAHKGDNAAIYSFLSSNLAKRILVHAAGKKGVKFTKKPYRSKPQYIDEKKTFDLGNRQISIISLPGHTKGSIALVDEKEKMIFSGDDVNPYLWLQLPGCTSVQTWYDHAAPFVELCKNYP